MMRHKLTSMISTFLIVSFSPTAVLAAIDQYGFPANCSPYAVCEGEICISTHFMPTSSFRLGKEDQAFIITDRLHDRHHKAGLFDTLTEAKRVGLSTEDGGPDYRYLLVPNDDIADAFGLDLYSVLRFFDGSKRLAEQFTKISCSKIFELREPN